MLALIHRLRKVLLGIGTLYKRQLNVIEPILTWILSRIYLGTSIIVTKIIEEHDVTRVQMSISVNLQT